MGCAHGLLILEVNHPSKPATFQTRIHGGVGTQQPDSLASQSSSSQYSCSFQPLPAETESVRVVHLVIHPGLQCHECSRRQRSTHHTQFRPTVSGQFQVPCAVAKWGKPLHTGSTHTLCIPPVFMQRRCECHFTSARWRRRCRRWRHSWGDRPVRGPRCVSGS